MTLQSRLQIVYTIPHLAVFLSLLTLLLYTSLAIRAETTQHRQSDHLANRAALVYLADHLPSLTTSLASLTRHLRLTPSYKLIILHDDTLTPSAQGRLQALSEIALDFRPLPYPVNSSSSFWSVTALLHDPSTPPFADLDYIIRLSSKGTFRHPVKQDFVKAFVMQRAQYGYHILDTDCENVTTVRSLATSYVDLNGIQPRSESHWRSVLTEKCLPSYAGAFELINLRFFRSHSGIQDWLRVVDTDDAVAQREGVVRYLTVALYAAPGKVLSFEKHVPFRV